MVLIMQIPIKTRAHLQDTHMYQELQMMTEPHGYLSNNLPVKIINDIIYATQLVEDLVLGKIKIVDFLKSYNNFYYWLGLLKQPGH